MNILALTYWSYQDGLIQSYTLPYLRIISKYLPEGSKIFLVTLEQEKMAINEEERTQINLELAENNIYLITLKYFPFGGKALLKWIRPLNLLRKVIKRNNIKVIHSFCTPAGAIAYILSRVTGTKQILDSFEPHAEAMVENGTWNRNSLAFRVMFAFEKLQAHNAKIAIACATGMKEYAYQKYGAEFDRFYVKPACVDLSLFSKESNYIREKYHLQGKVVCIYAGKFGGIYLKKEVFDFFKVAYEYWGNSFRILLLTSHTDEEVRNMAGAVELPLDIIVKVFVKHKEVADYMNAADFGITPVKSVPTKKYCTPIKDGEYWAAGLPVVITPNISDDSAIIKEHDIGAVLSSLDKEGYERALKKIDEILKKDKDQVKYKIRAVAENYRNFSIAEDIYRDIYQNYKK